MQTEIQGDASQAYAACQPDYRATLVAPLDDMWAAFAEMAEPYALLVGGRVAGCCTVNGERELQHFYLQPEFEDRAEELFAHLIDHLKIVAALPSTVDPHFLSLSIAAGHASVGYLQ